MPRINDILSQIDDLRECVNSENRDSYDNKEKAKRICEMLDNLETNAPKVDCTYPAKDPIARIHAKASNGNLQCEVEVINHESIQADMSPINVYSEPRGDVVVTRDPLTRKILAVTRQDDEGRILSIIAEAPSEPKPLAILQKTLDGEARITFRNKICDVDPKWENLKQLYTVRQVAATQAGLNQTGFAHLWSINQEDDACVSAVQWEVTSDGVIAHGKTHQIKSFNVASARATLPPGLVNIGRSCSDTPCVIENWLEVSTT